MKTSTLPPLRVEPRLRSEAERALRDGETLSSFIVDAVEERVRNRALDEEFVRRGLANGEEARRTGEYVSAAKVLARLRRHLERSQKAADKASGKRSKKR
ncbi:MAG TPA: YlcI/YnfO family protein [Myxococcales bacterium]|nr:YlcI/YnfO family protein [Myxococcales bacterium]